MQTNEWLQVAGTVGAILIAVFAWIQNRRKPKLDEATTENIRQTVKKQADENNARRDRRLLDLEKWGFERVMPWGRTAVAVVDKMCDLIREDRATLGLEMPEIYLPPFPDMPPPLDP